MKHFTLAPFISENKFMFYFVKIICNNNNTFKLYSANENSTYIQLILSSWNQLSMINDQLLSKT